MKKITCFILPVILSAFLLNSCQPKVDTEKEKSANKAVIDAETQAWIDKDRAKYADLYIHDEDQIRAIFSQNFSAIYNGAKYKSASLQSMVLQKIDGNWKISCFLDANVPPPTPPSEKDRKGKYMIDLIGTKTHGFMSLFRFMTFCGI